MSSLWQRWIADIPNLDNDDWSNVWDFPFKQLVSLYNRLIQIKIVHRAYFTPYWVHKMDPSFSQCCWRWSHSPGNYIHIFWSCPAIVQFWVSVLQIIQSGSGVVVPSSPCACLLGLVEELDSTTAARISFFFFYARKSITLTWKKAHSTHGGILEAIGQLHPSPLQRHLLWPRM